MYGKYKNTPLHFVASKGLINVLNFMKNQIEDKYPENFNHTTPLLKAVENGHFDIVESLLDDFAKLDWDTQNKHIKILENKQISSEEYAKTMKILQNFMEDQCPKRCKHIRCQKLR